MESSLGSAAVGALSERSSVASSRLLLVEKSRGSEARPDWSRMRPGSASGGGSTGADLVVVGGNMPYYAGDYYTGDPGTGLAKLGAAAGGLARRGAAFLSAHKGAVIAGGAGLAAGGALGALAEAGGEEARPRYRRMNVLNPRALRRSMRRVQGFARFASKTMSFTRRHKMKKSRSRR